MHSSRAWRLLTGVLGTRGTRGRQQERAQTVKNDYRFPPQETSLIANQTGVNERSGANNRTSSPPWQHPTAGAARSKTPISRPVVSGADTGDGTWDYRGEVSSSQIHHHTCVINKDERAAGFKLQSEAPAPSVRTFSLLLTHFHYTHICQTRAREILIPILLCAVTTHISSRLFPF